MLESLDYTKTYKLQKDDKYRYLLNNKPIVGVTTAIKQGYPKSDRLLRWQIAQGIKEYETGEKVKAAASIGRSLHAYAEAKTLQRYNDVNVIVAAADSHVDRVKILNTMTQFDKWYEKNKPDEILMTEGILCSWQYRFAGTLDLLVKTKNKVILRDYKTTSGIYATHWIQLALYMQGLKEWYNIKVNEIEVVQFSKEGQVNTQKISDKKIIKVFKDQGLRAVETYYFREKYDD